MASHAMCMACCLLLMPYGTLILVKNHQIMSNFTEKATVELFINGEQAKQTIARLSKDLDEYKNKLVEAYATMDSAMANTQKFTGMTRDQVESLNEEFKKMDTRTSREGLNELAIKRISRKSMTCGLLTFLSG